MKKTFFLPLVTILLATAILLGLSFGLKCVTEFNYQKVHQQLMQTLLPGSTNFIAEPYTGSDTNIRSVHKGETGFVIETVTYGYAGEITMLIGVSKEGKVTGLTVTNMQETFGLGGNALTDEEFLKQFLNTEGNIAVGVQADAFSSATGDSNAKTDSSAEADTYVDAISGATVTSKAIVRCVNSAVAYVTGADVGSGATSWGG